MSEPNPRARPVRLGKCVSTWVSPQVLTALDAVARSERVTRAEYVSRCICIDEKIQKLWIEDDGRTPKISSSDQTRLAIAYQIARASTLLDSLLMGIEECRSDGSGLDMLTVAEHLHAIQIALEERIVGVPRRATR